MAENTLYFDSITSARAMLLTPEEALEGNTTISIETGGEYGEEDIYSFLTDHFDKFLVLLRCLNKEDQEILLSYYLLSKSQNTLALIHKSTQTQCSTRIRMAVKTIGTFLMMGGTPSEAVLRQVFETTGYEHKLDKPLSKVVMRYAECKSFVITAKEFNLHRPDIRRAMSSYAKAHLESTSEMEAAIAVWIHSLIDKVSPLGTGYNRRKVNKMGTIYLKDPSIVGEFRLSVEHPDFDKVFMSRANR